MPTDPIERLSADIEIYAVPQAEGQPPMTDALLHVRRRQDGAKANAILGLPAYQGRRGPAGPPAVVHKGEKTTVELAALAPTAEQVNWAWRNVDTDDQHVWTGTEWIIYHDVYSTPGPAGPPPSVASGSLTVGGAPVDGAFGVRIAGSAGAYSLGLDLPAPPPGAKGDTGPSGSIIESVDIREGSTPAAGDSLVYTDSDDLVWKSVEPGVREYVAPPSAFLNSSVSASTTRIDILTMSIPGVPYPYRLDITGDMDVSCVASTQIDLEIRKTDTSGDLVGLGRTGAHDGWRPVAMRSHTEVAITPESSSGVIAADTPLVLVLSAVKRAGVLAGWSVRKDRAQLRVKLIRTVS